MHRRGSKQAGNPRILDARLKVQGRPTGNTCRIYKNLSFIIVIYSYNIFMILHVHLHTNKYMQKSFVVWLNISGILVIKGSLWGLNTNQLTSHRLEGRIQLKVLFADLREAEPLIVGRFGWFAFFGGGQGGVVSFQHKRPDGGQVLGDLTVRGR